MKRKTVKKKSVKRKFEKKFPEFIIDKPEMCKLGALKSPIIFDTEEIFKKYEPESRRCDEFVFCDIEQATGIYCIENKGGNMKYLEDDDICEQLNDSAKFLESYIYYQEKFKFLPVLVTIDKTLIAYRGVFVQLEVTMKDKVKAVEFLKKGEPLPPL